MSCNLQEALYRYFNFTAFRPGQKEVIEQVMTGRDVLAIMPTGQGKSLCYQLPALILPGLSGNRFILSRTINDFALRCGITPECGSKKIS